MSKTTVTITPICLMIETKGTKELKLSKENRAKLTAYVERMTKGECVYFSVDTQNAVKESN